MPALLTEVGLEETQSWSEVCARFGDLLHLEGPAPDAVVRRALEDDHYAFHLMMSRDNPSAIRRLLRDKRNATYASAPQPAEASIPTTAGSPAAAPPTPADAASNAELVKRAATAMYKWARSGFTQADPAEFDQRWGACQACPDLQEAPQKALYKLAQLTTSDTRVCGKCGCVAHRKAMLSTERCPAEDPSNPGFNRWGQPQVAR